MTENKRYSLVYYADKGGAFIKDNENGIEWYHDSRASLLEIVDKLNELHEENKEFMELDENRKEYQRTLESKIRRLKDRIKVLEK